MYNFFLVALINGEYFLAGGSLGIDRSFPPGFVDIPVIKTNVAATQKDLSCIIIELIDASAACENIKHHISERYF